MPKIKIKYELKSNDDIIKKELFGIKRNATILFKDASFTTSITIINQNIEMKRENSDACLTVYLGYENKGTYLLKEYHKTLDIEINLRKKQIDDNMIFFEYESNNNIVRYKLEYEVIPC